MSPEERARRVTDIRQGLAKQVEARRNAKPVAYPPRYDGVYWRGIAWLDRTVETGEEPSWE